MNQRAFSHFRLRTLFRPRLECIFAYLLLFDPLNTHRLLRLTKSFNLFFYLCIRVIHQVESGQGSRAFLQLDSLQQRTGMMLDQSELFIQDQYTSLNNIMLKKSSFLLYQPVNNPWLLFACSLRIQQPCQSLVSLQRSFLLRKDKCRAME